MRIDISKFCVENLLNETDFRLKLVERDSKCDTSKTVEKQLALEVLETFKNGLVLTGDNGIDVTPTNPTISLENELAQNSIETLKVADYLIKKTNDRLLENYYSRNLELVEKIREIRIARFEALENAFLDLDSVKVEKTNLTPVQKPKFDFFI